MIWDHGALRAAWGGFMLSGFINIGLLFISG